MIEEYRVVDYKRKSYETDYDYYKQFVRSVYNLLAIGRSWFHISTPNTISESKEIADLYRLLSDFTLREPMPSPYQDMFITLHVQRLRKRLDDAGYTLWYTHSSFTIYDREKG